MSDWQINSDRGHQPMTVKPPVPPPDPQPKTEPLFPARPVGGPQ